MWIQLAIGIGLLLGNVSWCLVSCYLKSHILVQMGYSALVGLGVGFHCKL